MPERYTGRPSRPTACASACTCGASTTAWLPITASGRSARRSAAAACASAAALGIGVRTGRGVVSAGSWLPSSMRSAWRRRYQRSARSGRLRPWPAASAYHWRTETSS